MKIFISHSSKDKWAAKRISDDLITLGNETFLDEKDIKTGQSLDLSIKDHLGSCDDFLVLLSPASKKSEWVLIELGGAIALGKTIVPILLYVGPNELPQVINLKLARDINDIQLYYEEVKSRLSGKAIKKTIKPKKITNRFKIGDKVKVISKRPEDVMSDNLLIDWEPDMDVFLGRETTIRKAYDNGTYSIEIDQHNPGTYYNFAEEWLIPMD